MIYILMQSEGGGGGEDGTGLRTHLLIIILVQVLGEDVAIERLAVLVHGWLAPPTGVVPEGCSRGDGCIQARNLDAIGHISSKKTLYRGVFP